MTLWIPEPEQYSFNQAADIWAVGAAGVRVVYLMIECKEAHETLAKDLQNASKVAAVTLQV